jgi:hypothetical protein
MMADPSALFRAAMAQLTAGDDAAAEATLRQVDALVPGDPAVLHKFGDIATLRGDHATAEEFYRQAHACVPEAPGYRMVLGHAQLFRGDYAGGFPLYDAWRELPEGKAMAAPDVPIAKWRGEPLAGKRVLVWSEEGLGDQIMYARFVLELQRRGAAVVWAAPPALVRLFSESLGVEAIPAGVGQAVPGRVDYFIPSSQLPALLMPELRTPPPAPYLRVAPAPRAGVRIGVKGRGNPENLKGAHRSLDPTSIARLLALPGAIDLEPENTGARDFHDTAALVASLDLVVSIDTSVAHLAGALGVATWVLLPARRLNWRWGRSGSESAWYGSARLFRQQTPDDWTVTVDEVIAALQAGA